MLLIIDQWPLGRLIEMPLEGPKGKNDCGPPLTSTLYTFCMYNLVINNYFVLIERMYFVTCTIH